MGIRDQELQAESGAITPQSSYRDIPISFAQFIDLMLIALADRIHDGVDETGVSLAPDDGVYYYDFETVARDEGFIFEPSWLENAANQLEAEVLAFQDLKEGHKEGDRTGISLEGAGYWRAQALVSAYYDTSVPASDRFVNKSDNQVPWDEAVVALESVISEFKKDHPRDNEFGLEKSAILKSLEAGRELFDDTRINIEIGSILLIEQLKLVCRKYDRELVAALATTALNAIAKLFGI